jgi:tetratricopeptide (TPR) repeat protein
MVRYESDYIMRMIHLLRQLMEVLMGTTEPQQRDAGLRAIADTMARLTGITPDAALSLTPVQLSALLGDDGDGLARRYAVAELLRMQGELYERFGQPLDAERSLRKALMMIFQTVGVPEELLRQSYPHAYRLFSLFFANMDEDEYAAAGGYFDALCAWERAEDAYCAKEDTAAARACYLRLLEQDEATLEAGGLTRAEVLEGYERILRIEGEADSV